MDFFCELTVEIRWLPSLFNMGKSVSSTGLLVNSETSNSVNSFNFPMCAFLSKCFPMELFLYSDGRRRTRWHTIHMMTGLPVSSIAQCKLKCHERECLELFQAIGRFERTFITAHQASNMICKVRSLKSQIKMHSFLEDIITYSNKVFIDLESDMVVWIWKLCNCSWETVKSYIIAE